MGGSVVVEEIETRWRESQGGLRSRGGVEERERREGGMVCGGCLEEGGRLGGGRRLWGRRERGGGCERKRKVVGGSLWWLREQRKARQLRTSLQAGRTQMAEQQHMGGAAVHGCLWFWFREIY